MYTRASQRDNNGRAAVATSSPPLKPERFTVYQNPTLSAALTTTTLRPSSSSLLLLLSLSFLSAVAFFVFSSREYSIIDKFKVRYVSEEIAYLLVKVAKTVFGVAFIGAFVALVKAISFMRPKAGAGVVVTSSSNGAKVETCLSDRQLCLLGLKKKNDVVPEQARKPPVSKSRASTTASNPLFPLHQQATSSSLSSRFGFEKTSATTSKTFVTPIKSSKSPASNLLSPISPQISTGKASTGLGQFSSPWSNKRASPVKVILTEDALEDFLADMDKKITDSAEKIATPPTRNGFSLSSPSSISGSANTSGTTRTTPLRPVRMSPSSQKYNTPPKKGEGDIPTPMSMEESLESFEHLGIYPQIEGWRDHLRQWFSSVLLNPLLSKIGNSHNKVMQAAAKLGLSITVTSIGSDPSDSGGSGISPVDRAKEWQPAFAPDEDGLLHQLRAYLVQAVDASTQKWNSANQQQTLQQHAILPLMQECVDAITEHQKLLALTKGELIKGVLPQSIVPSDYTVRRIKELAEGTCLKNYEYMQKEVSSDKANKKWTLELPSDSHLLLYLFCAFLEYPKWMLHVDPSSYSGALSSKNPLFLGGMPPKERFPEKYIAVLSVVPSTLHPGACVLVIGRQCPPVLVMYWDKKLQVCLQGRTALWDSILLLCHRIKTAYGGLVRGIHLGSTALSILPLLESEEEN